VFFEGLSVKPLAIGAKSSPRILIIKMSSLGDLFHALPAVHSLKTGLNATIDWVVNSQYRKTVECFTDVDRVIEFPRRNIVAGYKKLRCDIRLHTYDIVIDMQGLLKSAFVAMTAKRTRRIGPSFCREFAHLFYRELAGVKDKNRHAVEECLDVVRYLGLDIDRSPPPVAFPKYPIHLPRPSVAFAPASRWKTKNWSPEYFIKTGLALQKECHATIFLVGAKEDRPVCEQISDGFSGGIVNTAGKTDIPQLAGLLSDMDLLISVDSGPVHIAATLQTPVLGLYGLTNPIRTGPNGEIHRVLRASGNSYSHSDFRKPTSQNLNVMQSIKPATVIEVALQMLKHEFGN